MPPINTQGTRGGLITAVVVFVILFVTSAIFAIYFNVQFQDSQKKFTELQKTYRDVVSDSAFSTPQFTSLKALMSDSNSDLHGLPTVFDAALKQRDDLAQRIKGAPSEAGPAETDADTTLAAAAKNLKGTSVTVPATGLTAAINALVQGVVAKQANIADLTTQLAASQKALTDANTSIAAQNAQRDKAIEDAKAQAASDLQKANDQFKSNSDMVAQLQQSAKDNQDKAQKDAQVAQGQVADAQKQAADWKAQYEKVRDKLAKIRPDVTNSAIRQADGKIIRIPSKDTCYINLGQGDQVSPGLTFEVYDKAEGIPPIPPSASGDEQLPVGKASIEITRVGATSSECRIVNTAPGVVLSEGDLIENLIYDPNVKYNFYVYGNFDLANTGRPTSADGVVIQQLISQWGGKITDKVNVDTDFVILGKEPELPNYTKEEMEQPLNQKKFQDAQAEAEKYQQISQTARELHIPILNQNRFLYYVGYYDQAKR